eukprot:6287786-Alexandrium_andersonii.AAC.1
MCIRDRSGALWNSPEPSKAALSSAGVITNWPWLWKYSQFVTTGNSQAMRRSCLLYTSPSPRD